MFGKCHRFWFLTLPFTLLQQATPTSNFGSHHVVTRSTRWALPVFADSSSDSDAASISQDRSFHFGKRGLWEISRITHDNDNNGCIFKSKAKNLLEVKNSTMIIFLVKQGPDWSVKLCPLTSNYKLNFHAYNSEIVAEGREGGPLVPN